MAASISRPSWFARCRSRRIYLVCFFTLYLGTAVSYVLTDHQYPLLAVAVVDLILQLRKRKRLWLRAGERS